MHKFLLIVAMAITSVGVAQQRMYTVANAHSHNDYENTDAFQMAYGEQFGSIEADIFLQNNELIVAHDSREVLLHRTLDKLYLEPLVAAVRKNNGFVYPDNNRQLQMLIDIKTDSINTLNKLIEILKDYPALINNKTITWTITGNRPSQELFTQYPSFISFDGELYKDYSAQALTRIVMLSDDFRNYSQWNGNNIIPVKDKSILQNAISKAHQLHKPVRFWDAPDNMNAWKKFMQLKVDYINTDHINDLADFLKKQ